MDERTRRPHEWKDAATVRPFRTEAAAPAPANAPGKTIGRWKVTGVLAQHEQCTVYRGVSASQEQVVIKVFKDLKRVPPELKRAAGLHDHRLLSILETGVTDGMVYEVTPYLPGGSLDGQRLPDEVVMTVVIPQLIHALRALHGNSLLHNDVKPSNIFWVEPGKQIVLGDYDCLSMVGKPAPGGTREYMAPEVFTGGAAGVSPASDLCSMGLTLLALLMGGSPLQGKLPGQIRRAWMNSITAPESIPARVRLVINGLIQFDPAKRMTVDGVYHWMQSYHVHHDEAPVEKTVSRSGPLSSIQPLWHQDNALCSIGEMVAEAGTAWEWGCFMLKQRKLGMFLRQFGLEQYELCTQCESVFDQDAALFRLLHGLSRTSDFYWCGNHFDDLSDFSGRMLNNNDEAANSQGAHFLRTGMLGVYLRNIGARQEQLEMADKLAETARHNPELAMTQLLTTMSASPELKWKEQVFTSLSDLADWLVRVQGDLDAIVKELYESRRFEAWLTFIKQGRFLYEIQSDMKGIRT